MCVNCQKICFGALIYPLILLALSSERLCLVVYSEPSRSPALLSDMFHLCPNGTVLYIHSVIVQFLKGFTLT